MLSYALAIAVAISSLVLFLTAFLMSDVHRQDDFLWSGLGLFYALILWFCSRNITGAVLLGQASVSVLLISFVWQTLKLRKAIAHPERASEINNFSVLQAVNGLLSRGKKPQAITTPSVDRSPEVVTESKIAIPETTSTEDTSPQGDKPTSQEKSSKPGMFDKFLGKKSAIANTKLDKKLEESEVIETETTAKPKSAIADTQAVDKASPTIVDNNKNETEVDNKSPESKLEEIKNVELEGTVNSVEETEVADKIETNPPEIVEQKASPQTEEIKPSAKKVDTADTKTPVETESEDASTDIKENSSPQVEDTTFKIDAPEQTIQDNSESEINVTQIEVESESKVNITQIEVNSKPEVNVTQIEINSESDNTPTEIKEEKEEVQPAESKTKASQLDSLETVEVAEVLEAIPEDISNERNSDRSNIIEVNTTEIDDEEQNKQ